MSETAYYARMTLCECGHEGIAHYDSHDFCTYTMDDPPSCSCQAFKAAGPEVLVQVGGASTTDELGSSPEVSPRPCPSCGCGSPSHTVDCEQADAA